ncbi:cytochrome P450 [Xylogone sp. PMI_703]|nr:cytochrome P450 [Xylogone sp. PMI_703]
MEGGSETSSSIIIAAMQAFAKWPEVMKKAQEEIDSVMGEDRSPVWVDYNSLPYVAAIVKEAMRWRPAVPMAFPHYDWYEGYKIPKGSTILINAWGVHQDEKRFPNPDVFNPDNYKGATALASELAQSSNPDDRDHYGYGSGRRMCPGIHIAERNMFLGISKLLWAFEFTPGKDANGKMIDLDTGITTGYTEGFVVSAKPYPLNVKVRSEQRRETILREFEQAQKEVLSLFDD